LLIKERRKEKNRAHERAVIELSTKKKIFFVVLFEK
jgi:hypothetical protein